MVLMCASEGEAEGDPSAISLPGRVSLLYGNPALGGVPRRGTDHWVTGCPRRVSPDSDNTGSPGGRLILGHVDRAIPVAPGN